MRHLKSLFKSSRRWYNYSALLILTVVLSIFYIIQMTFMNSFINAKYGQKEEADNLILDEDDLLYSNNKFDGEKIVHLDLKGAPPRISYLKEFIPFVKGLGASGILLEYEDMFPYHGELEKISALNAYTPSDIAAIIEAAEHNNLTIIPLVPTFGHLEFVLKLEQFKDLREVEMYPNELCPSNKNVYPILYKMIDQILAAHPKAQYLHIGNDEVHHTGLCPKCQSLMKKNKWNKDEIYFIHVKKVASYIAKNHPNVRPILWGQKFLKQNEKIILRHQIPDFVDIMVWNYRPTESAFPRSEDVKTYARLFKNIWIASAFKGATGTTRILTNPEYHMRNTLVWMNFVKRWKNIINFKGILLSGWQRYSHFSLLCELLPVGIPSLAFSLQLMTSEKGSNYDDVKHALRCNDLVPRNLIEMLDLRLICDYPGYKIYKLVNILDNSLQELRALLNQFDLVDFSIFSITHNTSNPIYVYKPNLNTLKNRLSAFYELEDDIRAALSEVYDKYTVDEWVMTYMMPSRLRMEAAINLLTVLRSRRVWPRRPAFDTAPRVRQFFNKTCGTTETLGCTFLNIR